MTKKSAGISALLLAFGIMLAACASPTGTSQPSAVPPQAQPAAQGSPATGATGAEQTLTIATGDYYFKPDEIRFRPGAIQLTINNEGPRRHKFALRNLADTEDMVSGNDSFVAGESETVKFTLNAEGRYRMYCTIPGHAERGEIGWIVIANS